MTVLKLRDSVRLNDGTVISATELAAKVGITPQGALHRLKQSRDPNVVFATVHSRFNGQAPVQHTLSNGKQYTIRQLSELSGLRPNVIRSRLAKSNDLKEVIRPLAFENLNAKIYQFQDGSETTVTEFANARGVSASAAYELLESLNLTVRYHRAEYTLTDGQKVTLEDVVNATGLSESGAKKRLLKSKDPLVVLAPSSASKDRPYILSDGTSVTVAQVMERAGVSKSEAIRRLATSRSRVVVFKRKQRSTVTMFVPTEDGLLVQQGRKNGRGQFVESGQELFESL